MKLAERDEIIRQYLVRRKEYATEDYLRRKIKTSSVVQNDLELSRV